MPVNCLCTEGPRAWRSKVIHEDARSSLGQLAGCHPTSTTLSPVPMGSSEFPHGVSQEGQGGRGCVWQGVADKHQLPDPA